MFSLCNSRLVFRGHGYLSDLSVDLAELLQLWPAISGLQIAIYFQ